MDIDLIEESEWTSVLTGEHNIQFEFLALQLFLAKLRNRLQAKAVSVDDCVRELKAFYKKFSRLPMAESDFNKIARREKTVTHGLLDPLAVARRIVAGRSLILAGEQALLETLPPGNWIGGTIPYFMTQEGGCVCKDKIFVTEVPGEFQVFTHPYAEADLPDLFCDAESNSVSFVILPADSRTHVEFALRAPRYPDFALHPLVGWVAGIDLKLLGKATPKVFCGGPRPLDDAAALMRIKLPANHLAQIKIVNLFKPGNGDTICFPATGFSATTAVINGREQNFAEYLNHTKADTRVPLVANYCGALVNVSLKNVDRQNGRVDFYAPVVAGTEYKLAIAIEDYVSEFEAHLQPLPQDNVLFSCNCILNYLYCRLEGRRASTFVGPVTFGEIAFQLLNQTLIYVEVVKVSPSEPRRAIPEATSASLQLSAAYEELQASEHRFRSLTDCAPLGIYLTDPDGRVLYENPCCRKLCGVSTEGAAIDGCLQAMHPNDRPGVMAALEESERERRDFDEEFRFVRAGSVICWIRLRTTLLRSEDGESTGRIGIVQDITGHKQREIELERVNKQLIRASREAGIAEAATDVLHNVKNIINSINISASVIARCVKQSMSSSLTQVVALLREHANDLGTFITEDPRGKLVPGYLEQLAQQLVAERAAVLEELQQFEANLQHIKSIVIMQQDCARLGGTSENARPVDLMEDSLRFNLAALARHGIQVVRDYEANLPDVTVEKHKILQILVNFIQNAKHACQASGRPDKKLVLRLTNDGGFVHFGVTDNGIGIAPENLGRICERGFTTKESGHGFGLHSAALGARELGGKIQVHSDGINTGAEFALSVPLRRPPSENAAPG